MRRSDTCERVSADGGRVTVKAQRPPGMPAWSRSARSVSYTHLDVYKRQVQAVVDRLEADATAAEAAKLGADLLVMGGYSHSRLREVVFGGFTRHTLTVSTVPVLMAH